MKAFICCLLMVLLSCANAGGVESRSSAHQGFIDFLDFFELTISEDIRHDNMKSVSVYMSSSLEGKEYAGFMEFLKRRTRDRMIRPRVFLSDLRIRCVFIYPGEIGHSIYEATFHFEDDRLTSVDYGSMVDGTVVPLREINSFGFFNEETMERIDVRDSKDADNARKSN